MTNKIYTEKDINDFGRLYNDLKSCEDVVNLLIHARDQLGVEYLFNDAKKKVKG
tara:strand:- start:3519 stop:3680 length:162 start_codon:yes stop_codon:yes gene_type:complete